MPSLARPHPFLAGARPRPRARPVRGANNARAVRRVYEGERQKAVSRCASSAQRGSPGGLRSRYRFSSNCACEAAAIVADALGETATGLSLIWFELVGAVLV